MTKAIIILLLFTSSVFAGDINYWNIEIPIKEGSFNITSEKDENFYTISKNYNIEIVDPSEIYNFYETFFVAIGWVNPINKFQQSLNNFQGKWSLYRKRLKNCPCI